MAIIALPAAAVLEAVAACQAAGIPALTVYSSGVTEASPAGQALEAELRRRARERGTLLCGPNSQGVANFYDRVAANFTSSPSDLEVPVGPLGFVSQSGLFGGIALAECVRRGPGLGYLVSTGNEAGVEFSDVLGHLARDPRVTVIGGYLEGPRDGERFREAIRLAHEHRTSVVLLKVGHTETAARAAASHTRALAGSYRVYQEVFRQWGVVEVDDVEELFDTLALFALEQRPCVAGRIAVLTNSGGMGVFCADKAQELGLRMATLAPETRAAIATHLPEFGSPDNPVDITLQAFSETAPVGSHLRHLAADPGVDALLVVFGVQRLNVPALVEEIRQTRQQSGKPLVVAWMAGAPEGPRLLAAAGVPIFLDPLRALKALRALAR